MKTKKKTIRIGFDLGGTKMLAAVFDEKLKPLGKSKRKTRGNRGPDEGIARMLATIEEAIKEAGVNTSDIASIGVAAPAPMNLKNGVLENPTNMRWGNVPIKKIFEEKFKCPTRLVNDVDAGTFGEYRFGAGKGFRSVLGVFPGTGLGGGFVLDGKILTGTENPCMEIGHIRVLPNGLLCGCGNRGCLETVTSRLAVAAELAMAAFRGDAPHLFEVAGTDIAKMGSHAIAESIQKGDRVVEAIVRKSAEWLGIGIAGAVTLLLPEVVVLGGGMVEAMPEIYLKEVSDSLKRNVFGNFSGKSKIRVAKCGDDATALGAAALGIEGTS
jgi:glucokinase